MINVQTFVALLGYFTLLVVAVALGQAVGWSIRRKRNKPMFGLCTPSEGEDFCVTHECGPYEQCGLLSCPHCAYKYDPEAGALGYATAGSDPTKAENYPRSVDEQGGLQGNPDSNPDTLSGYGPPEPVKYRLKRVKPENFSYHMTNDGVIDEALETDDDGCCVIAYEKLPDTGAYEHYQEALDKAVKRTGLIPHCDSNIMHAPGECEFCDDGYPDLQEFRAMHGINFTGHYDPNKLLCPAELSRDLATIEHWGGNRKETWETKTDRDYYFSVELPAALAEAQAHSIDPHCPHCGEPGHVVACADCFKEFGSG